MIADNTNPRNNNTNGEITHNKMSISLSECIIFFTVFTAEYVAIVTLNLLSIILFIKNKSLRTRGMYLVISLTVADLLVGSLSQSVDSFYSQNLFCPSFIKFYLLPREVMIAFDILCLLFPLVSLTNIAVISLERFHATFRPFRHRLIKRWVYVAAIAVVWVVPIITLVIFWVERFLIKHHLYLMESHCCLCLIVTFVSYTSIMFKFRFGAHPQGHCAAALKQRKLTITLFITTLVSLLLWLPYSISVFVDWLTKILLNSLSRPERIRFMLSMNSLRYANSLVNPILYTIRMPNFRKALLSLFRRPQRENVAIPLNRY